MSTRTHAQKPSPRLNASLTVVLSNGGAPYVVETKNLSDTGLCLRSEEVFPIGSQLHLVFGQPPELPRLSTEGIVRWAEGGKGVGVQFTSIRPADHQALLRFVIAHAQVEQA